VNDRNQPGCCKDMEELLLRYAMNTAEADERNLVEEHLRKCGPCTQELAEIQKTIGLLREHREAFCPTPEELYDYASEKKDPEGRLAKHLKECPRCAEYLKACERFLANKSLPHEIWEKVVGADKKLAAQTYSSAIMRMVIDFLDRTRSFAKLPAAAIGAAVAVMLLVVFLYPGTPEPILGMSSINWGRPDNDLVPKLGKSGRPKERLAILIFYEGLKIPQEKIDSLYETLKPSPPMEESFDVITPEVLKEAFKAGKISLKTKEEMLKGLNTNLRISKTILLTVISQKRGTEIQGELVETQSGHIVRISKQEVATEGELPSKLKATADSVAPTPDKNSSRDK
jgi:hypothetical protein